MYFSFGKKIDSFFLSSSVTHTAHLTDGGRKVLFEAKSDLKI